MIRRMMSGVLLIGTLFLVPGPANAGSKIVVSQRAEARAAKEVARGDRKAAGGKSRRALTHYLYALELNPFSAGARAGLDALAGNPEPGSRKSGCPEAIRPAGASTDGPRSAARMEGSVLGHVPESPRGRIRKDGPHFESARPYIKVVQKTATRHGVDPRLILAVIKAESNFNPRARSRSGARGLMQLMPATAARFGARSIDDPAQNINAGTKYLRYLLELFKGDVNRALAGYLAGEMTVVKHGGVPRTKGVQTYIRRVRAYASQF